MAPSKRALQVSTTLPFEKFWTWLQGHPNCILRAGTPDAVLCDHEDFHWSLITENKQTYVVQVGRAKDMVGELVLLAAEVAYVQCEPSEHEGEWVFECINEGESAREVLYHFILSHEYDGAEHRGDNKKWTH